MKVLYPLSIIYSFLYKLDKKLTIANKLPRPVISVGNVTVGGTGKTPIVIELLKLLLKNRLKPTVLARGYGRKTRKTILLQDGVTGVDINISGDEPMLICKSVPNASIIIGKNRYDNAIKLKDTVNTDVYVLDDGFQHWSIKRDLDIVCINAFNPFGNGMLIPAGILREPIEVLKRAHIIILTNSDMIAPEQLTVLKNRLLNLTGKDPIVTCYESFEYIDLDLETNFDINFLKSLNLYSLSAIGFTSGFKNSILKSGLTIRDSISLKDHSYFNNNFLKNIIKKYKADYFIVTAKDAVKFDGIDNNIKRRIIVLKTTPKFITGKKQWENSVLNILQFS